MARNTAVSQFNRTNHDENVDEESSLRAAHAALAKMASLPEPVQGPAPVAPIASTAPLAAPVAAASNPMAHPAFHGIMAALRRPRAASPLKVAGTGSLRKLKV